MKRNTIKEVDRVCWSICISLLILFFSLSQIPGVFLWAEDIESYLYGYLNTWSILFSPLIAFSLYSLQISVLFVFIFSRIRSLEIILSATVYGVFIFYLGDPSKYLIQSTLAVILGVILHSTILGLFSKLSSMLPSLVESQNWQSASLNAKISEPGYWAVILNVFFTISIAVVPVVIIQTWPATIGMKTFIFLGSASTLLGFHLLKKELILGYFLFAIPYAYILYMLFQNIEIVRFAFQSDYKLLIQNFGNLSIFLVVTIICIANWKRLRFRSY